MNHEIFSDILRQINNQQIRDFTIECLKLADPILETIPASTTGKYHPPEACQSGGLVYHIRRACHFAGMFMNAYKFEHTDIKGDILYSALLLHDIGKKSHEEYKKDRWAYPFHPQNAVKIISAKKDMLPEKVFNVIASCVLTHMGVFGVKEAKKPIETFTFLELAVYQCDYLSSRKDLILNVEK